MTSIEPQPSEGDQDEVSQAWEQWISFGVHEADETLDRGTFRLSGRRQAQEEDES